MKNEPSVYSDVNNKVSHTTGTTQLQKRGSHRRCHPREANVLKVLAENEITYIIVTLADRTIAFQFKITKSVIGSAVQIIDKKFYLKYADIDKPFYALGFHFNVANIFDNKWKKNISISNIPWMCVGMNKDEVVENDIYISKKPSVLLRDKGIAALKKKLTSHGLN